VRSEQHYKMYKKGRFWVFASLALLALQIGQVKAQAATDQSGSETDSEVKPTTVSVSSTKQVVLPSNSPKTTSATSASSAKSVANSSTGSQGTSADSQTQSSASSVVSSSPGETINQASQSGISAASQSSKTTTIKSSAIVSEPQPKGVTTTDTNHQSAVVASQNNRVSNQDQLADTTSLQTSQLTTLNVKQSTVLSSQLSVKSPATIATDALLMGIKTAATRRMSRLAALPQVVDSGTIDNSDVTWSLDDVGTLSLSAGTIDSPTGWRMDYAGIPDIPWNADLEKVKLVKLTGPIVAKQKLDYLFAGLVNMTQIEGLPNLDTSQVTSMNSLFGWDYLITDLDLSNFNTSNVTDMENLFIADVAMQSFDISGFDTSKVTVFSAMFEDDSALVSLDLSTFDMSSGQAYAGMFDEDEALTTLNISSLDTTNVPQFGGYLGGMLSDMPNLQVLVLGSKAKGLTQAQLADPTVPGHYWQNVGTGTIAKPAGQYKYNSADLMANYDGSTMADTYVWKLNTRSEPESKTVTRMINYVDAQTNASVIPTVTQAVTFTRTKLFDTDTTDDQFVGYDTTGDGQPDTTVADEAWVPTASSTISAVTSPDLSARGYLAPSQATVDAADVTGTATDTSVTVTYAHASTASSATHPVQRVINYLDAQSGAVLAPSVTQIITYTQTKVIDDVSGQLLGYDTDGDGKVDTTDADAAWVPQGNTKVPAVVSPDLSQQGYLSASQTKVPAEILTGTAANQTVAVTYAHASQSLAETQAVKRVIVYVDQQTGVTLAPAVTQTVTYQRTKLIDLVTGTVTGYDTTGDGKVDTTDAATAWVVQGRPYFETVTSPNLTAHGYRMPSLSQVAQQAVTTTNKSSKVIVTYGHLTKSVPTQRTVTRTINYIDQLTGQSLTSPVVQTVTYKRMALIDQVNGQLLGYDLTGDGQVDTTVAAQAWVAVGNQTLATVTSPVIAGYQQPSRPQVDAQLIDSHYQGTNPIVVQVTYLATVAPAASGEAPIVVPIVPVTPSEPSSPIINKPQRPSGTVKRSVTPTSVQPVKRQNRSIASVSQAATYAKETVRLRENKTQLSDRVTPNKVATSASKLPVTNDQQNRWPLDLGVLGAVLIGLFGLGKTRKKD